MGGREIEWSESASAQPSRRRLLQGIAGRLVVLRITNDVQKEPTKDDAEACRKLNCVAELHELPVALICCRCVEVPPGHVDEEEEVNLDLD